MQTSAVELALDTPLKQYSPEIVRQVIESLPKIDLHRHLEGSISPESLIALALEQGIQLPASDVESLRPFVQVNSDDASLIDFLEKFKVIGKIFSSEQVIENITVNCLREAAQDNLVYTELRFSPYYIARSHGLDPRVVTEAVLRGMQIATAETGMMVNGIVIIERQESLVEAAAVTDLALAHLGRGVVALDLANDEFHYPPAPFAPIFQRARAGGLGITVHAGEAAGADNIRTAIELLQADRIGHGVRILEDPEVLELVRRLNIPLELCYTSNLQTGAVDGTIAYPLRELLERGIPVTINTDDPSISGITLSADYLKLVNHADLTLREVGLLLRNACLASFASDAVKADVFEKIDSGLRAAARSLVR